MVAAGRDALERDGDSLEGAFGSRLRRGLTRGGCLALERGGSPLEGARRIPTRPTSETDLHRGGAVPLEQSGVLPESG
jgi:hypothetical protein